jgi:AIR synthase-related protein
MSAAATAAAVAAHLRASRGFAHKRDIADAVATLGLGDEAAAIRVGDDCAAIPDGDGYLLFAIEGFVADFVAADPYFAGYCGVMVNVSDIAAMGGRPVAVVDALWSDGAAAARPVLDGLRDAARIYATPVVGGHTNARSGEGQLAVAVLGRARRLISSFDARPSDVLLAAIDLRGRFRDPHPYWDASSGAPAQRLRGDLDILPALAEAGLVTAGKDISMAGLVGTAIMLLEGSDVGTAIDLAAIPKPPGADMMRWLTAFPSFGFLLTTAANDAAAVIQRFAARGIACATIGSIDRSRRVRLVADGGEALVWDLAQPFIGCGMPETARCA